jgi:D-alanine-D-alanine ligase-like ATP-grasp enzyme
MFIRSVLVIFYVLFCVRLITPPWWFFKLNRRYYDHAKGIYSKQSINDLIPARFRLNQWFEALGSEPTAYPVFVKPEWGQNSKGVVRINNLGQLQAMRATVFVAQGRPLLVQEAATGAIEYEVFAIANAHNASEYACLSITQVVNEQQTELPINGIHNPNTSYLDITYQFSPDELKALWVMLLEVGQFRVCRFGIKAHNRIQLLAGEFKIIEINLLLPMPMVLLTSNTTLIKKIHLALSYAWRMALATQGIKRSPLYPPRAKDGLVSIINEVGD